MLLAILQIVLILMVGFLVAGFWNRKLGKWACDKMGWHFVDRATSFDGCSLHSKCARCGKDVMQDGQGNWF